MELLHHILSRNETVFAAKTGVVQGATRLTHAQVGERAQALAGALQALGVTQGDRVALLSRNDYRFVEMYFGLPSIGVVFVPLNFWAADEELAYVLDHCQASVLIAGPAYQDQVQALKARLPHVKHLIMLAQEAGEGWLAYERLLAQASVARPVEVAPDDDALILFTSGSTGQPKGAVYTHRALVFTALVMAQELGFRETDITLHFLPMFSSNLEHLLPTSLAGMTHVIVERFDAEEVWQTVAQERITHFDAVPTTMRMLLESEALENTDLSSFRLVTYASEPMPAATISAWMERLPHAQAAQFYGMIEFLCMTVQKPWEQRSHIGTVGKPTLGNLLRIIDDQGRDLPPGEVGEVVCKSPCAARGYWGDPALMAEVRPDGWMRSGDLGRLDAEGYLTLVGRKKDIIKTGGMTVVPAEVEAVLYEHPAVAEVAVVPRPDARYNESVHAVVALKPGEMASEADLIAFCEGRLSGYKKPRSIEFMESLPKTGIGKIARIALRERIAQEGGDS